MAASTPPATRILHDISSSFPQNRRGILTYESPRVNHSAPAGGFRCNLRGRIAPAPTPGRRAGTAPGEQVGTNVPLMPASAAAEVPAAWTPDPSADAVVGFWPPQADPDGQRGSEPSRGHLDGAPGAPAVANSGNSGTLPAGTARRPLRGGWPRTDGGDDGRRAPACAPRSPSMGPVRPPPIVCTPTANSCQNRCPRGGHSLSPGAWRPRTPRYPCALIAPGTGRLPSTSVPFLQGRRLMATDDGAAAHRRCVAPGVSFIR